MYLFVLGLFHRYVILTGQSNMSINFRVRLIRKRENVKAFAYFVISWLEDIVNARFYKCITKDYFNMQYPKGKYSRTVVKYSRRPTLLVL